MHIALTTKASIDINVSPVLLTLAKLAQLESASVLRAQRLTDISMWSKYAIEMLQVGLPAQVSPPKGVQRIDRIWEKAGNTHSKGYSVSCACPSSFTELLQNCHLRSNVYPSKTPYPTSHTQQYHTLQAKTSKAMKDLQILITAPCLQEEQIQRAEQFSTWQRPPQQPPQRQR